VSQAAARDRRNNFEIAVNLIVAFDNGRRTGNGAHERLRIQVPAIVITPEMIQIGSDPTYSFDIVGISKATR